MQDQLEAVITSLRFILRNCHVTSNLYLSIEMFEEALRFEGTLRDMTIQDARDKLLVCMHDEEYNENLDTAARLRDTLKM